MKPTLTALISVLLFAGCTSVPPELAAQMSSAATKYASVTKEMNREAIVALLGTPQKDEGATATWEVRHGVKNYESFVVEFDSMGRPIKMTKSSSRWSSSVVGEVGRTKSVVK